jgi:hypothetical protein
MERGKPDLTVYTFEVPEGSSRTMDYPAAELWTLDYQEAQAYAQEKGYQLIENQYEWQDSNLLEDCTPVRDCQYCGLPVKERDGGIWEDPDYEPRTEEARYCDEAPHHRHAPETS